jgi:hypothetical protein
MDDDYVTVQLADEDCCWNSIVAVLSSASQTKASQHPPSRKTEGM